MMSSFAKALNELIMDRNVRISELANYIGLNRSSLYKILNGSRRLPDPKLIDAIALFLTLSPMEKDELSAAYEMDIVGKDLYEQRKAVYDLIQSFHVDPETAADQSQFIVMAEKSEERKIQVLESSSQLEQALAGMLWREISLENPVVKASLQPDDDSILSLIRQILNMNPDARLEHLFLLQKGSSPKAGVENLAIYKKIIPFYACRFGYESYALYSSLIQVPKYAPVWPEMICTRNEVLFFNQFTQTGYLLGGQMESRFASEAFTQSLHHTHQQFFKVNDFTQLLFSLDFISGRNSGTIYDFQMFPCLTFSIPSSEVSNLIKDDIPQKQELIQAFTQYQSQKPNIESSLQTHYITSLEGLQNFLDTGVMNEYPEWVVNPPDPKLRLKIAENLVHRLPAASLRFLKPLAKPRDLSLAIYAGKSGGYITLTNMGREFIYIKVADPALLAIFQDYFSNLPDSWFYSNEEAAEKIEAMFADFRTKYNL